MLSKELLQAVLGIEIKEIRSIENDMVYYTYIEIPDGCDIHGRINIYELMGKTKEWALDNDCTIMSFIDFDGTSFAKLFNLDVQQKSCQQKVSFQGEKEYDAVFKAGQLILMEITNDK